MSHIDLMPEHCSEPRLHGGHVMTWYVRGYRRAIYGKSFCYILSFTFHVRPQTGLCCLVHELRSWRNNWRPAHTTTSSTLKLRACAYSTYQAFSLPRLHGPSITHTWLYRVMHLIELPTLQLLWFCLSVGLSTLLAFFYGALLSGKCTLT